MLDKCFGSQRARRFQRFLSQCKVTILCFFLTIVVLRGTIGAGKFGTPEQDFVDLRNRLSSRKLAEPHRVLGELHSTTNYNAFDINTILVDEEEEEERDPEKRNPHEPYRLGPKISNWDEQRSKWLRENPNYPNFIRPGKPRVLLVTGSSPKPCENPVGDHYLLKSIKNKIDYCRLHGIDVFYNMALFDAEMAGFWAKLPLIRKLLLSHPEVEFLWWMDSDAMFTDMAFEVPWER